MVSIKATKQWLWGRGASTEAVSVPCARNRDRRVADWHGGFDACQLRVEQRAANDSRGRSQPRGFRKSSGYGFRTLPTLPALQRSSGLERSIKGSRSCRRLYCPKRRCACAPVFSDSEGPQDRILASGSKILSRGLYVRGSKKTELSTNLPRTLNVGNEDFICRNPIRSWLSRGLFMAHS
jgi:hypothetical protein